jgi:hypothetical protein
MNFPVRRRVNVFWKFNFLLNFFTRHATNDEQIILIFLAIVREVATCVDIIENLVTILRAQLR